MKKVYDIESLANCFTYTDIDIDTNEVVSFAVVPNIIDQSKELYVYLKDLIRGRGHLMVGFNNIHYDWPMLSYFLEVHDQPNLPALMYKYSNRIIHEEEFRAVPRYSSNQLDLYLLHHYNNKNRRMGLKALQIALCWKNVQDMPIHHSEIISSKAELNTILEYNLNDVLSTQVFYEKSKGKVELRKRMKAKYKLDLENLPDASMGETIILDRLATAMGISNREIRNIKGKYRDIHLKDIIFDYISFNSPEFKLLLEKMNETVVGPNVVESFRESTESLAGRSVEDVYDEMQKKELKMKRTTSKEKKSFGYTVNYKEVTYVYGIGGLHACAAPGVYKTDDEYILLEVDAASYYPNLAIRNGLHPRQFKKEIFCAAYEGIYDERMEAKRTGDSIVSDGLKLALNAVFGKSLDKFSPLNDIGMFCGITINGQLLMTMLAERILDRVPSARMIYANTDGLMVRIKREDEHILRWLASKWEERTKIPLEFSEFRRIALRDVNNYIAEKADGKLKEKGDFETRETREKQDQWHKDFSYMAVPEAVKERLMHDVPILETLKKNTNIYDFCGRYKSGPGFHTEYVYIGHDRHGLPVEKRKDMGKTLRFIPVLSGGVCIKKHEDGREMHLLEGYQTIPYNDSSVVVDKNNIDLRCLEIKCMSIIDSVEVPQKTLFV